MTGIFVSYRREDAAGHAGRLFDRLRARFGESVFMDVSGIEPGIDFVDAIDRAVGSCDVLLAVIGREWLDCRDAGGRRRLEDPNDFIRIEVARALAKGVRVVPVLVEGATMPPADALPPDLQPLARRQAAELRDTRWDADVDDLIELLAGVRPARRAAVAPPVAPVRPDRRRARWPWVLAAGCLVLGVVVAALMARAPRYPQPYEPAPLETSAARAVPGPRRPDGGTSAVRGPEITAAQPAPRRLRGVVDLPLAEAQALLAGDGLQTTVVFEETRQSRPDFVVRQEPGPDAEIADDLRVVVLTVAREPAAPEPEPGGAAVKQRLAKERAGQLTFSPGLELALARAPVAPPLHIAYAEDADAPAAERLEDFVRRSEMPLSGVDRSRGVISSPGTLFYANEEHRDLAREVAQQCRSFLSRLYGRGIRIEAEHNPGIPHGSLVLQLPPREPPSR